MGGGMSPCRSPRQETAPESEPTEQATFTTSFDLLKWNSCLVSALQRQNNVKVNDDDDDEDEESKIVN